MYDELHPTKWYWPTPASDPVPCEWQGWLYGQWVTVYLCSMGD